MEQVQDRDLCNKDGAKCSKRHAPRVPTKFGIYVAGVCGKNLTESDLESAPVMFSPYVKVSTFIVDLIHFIHRVTRVVRFTGACQVRSNPCPEAGNLLYVHLVRGTFHPLSPRCNFWPWKLEEEKCSGILVHLKCIPTLFCAFYYEHHRNMTSCITNSLRYIYCGHMNVHCTSLWELITTLLVVGFLYKLGQE